MEEHCECCGDHDPEEEMDAANDEGEEMTSEEMAEEADDKVDALINLLVKKGVITDKEFDEAYGDLFEDDDSESS